MSRLRVLIADDEMPARSKMQRMLGSMTDIEVVYVAENGIDALEHIQQLRPDLIFLDIEMPGMTGLEVARSIELEPQPSVVFTTAYGDHAISAFEVNAIDYLLKPFNEERLQGAIEKVRKGMASHAGQGLLAADEDDETDETAEIDLKNVFSNKIAIPVRDRFRLIDVEDISCIEVEERSIRVFIHKESFLLSQSLDAFEKRLPMNRFFRISRSTIIGVEHIRELVIWFGNRFKIILADGREVVCSRERSKAIKHILKL